MTLPNISGGLPVAAIVVPVLVVVVVILTVIGVIVYRQKQRNIPSTDIKQKIKTQ